MTGIDPRTIPQHLRVVDDQHKEHVAETIPNKEKRFFKGARAWILDRLDTPRWEAWRWANLDVLSQVFTLEEQYKLWFDSAIASEVEKHLYDSNDLYWKVQNCLWQYGCGRDYNRMVRCYDGLTRLAFDAPDFDVRIVHTRGSNTAAWSWQIRDLYIDAPFGLVISYKGEHVLTVGFAFAADGILIAQVQLRKKKGNRFLYKLPKPYLDLAIDLIAAAYPDEPLWLIEGASAASAVKQSYPEDERDKITPEVEARIASFYNQPLREYVRTSTQTRRQRREHVLLKKGGL